MMIIVVVAVLLLRERRPCVSFISPLHMTLTGLLSEILAAVASGQPGAFCL